MWRKFPDKFREYYKTNVSDFNYIFDSMKNDSQSYCNFGKFTEAEEKLTVALQVHSQVLTLFVEVIAIP
jgi:hypothetical protein